MSAIPLSIFVEIARDHLDRVDFLEVARSCRVWRDAVLQVFSDNLGETERKDLLHLWFDKGLPKWDPVFMYFSGYVHCFRAIPKLQFWSRVNARKLFLTACEKKDAELAGRTIPHFSGKPGIIELRAACNLGDLCIVKRLFVSCGAHRTASASMRKSAFEHACAGKNLPLVEWLLTTWRSIAPNINGYNLEVSYKFAVHNGNELIARWLREHLAKTPAQLAYLHRSIVKQSIYDLHLVYSVHDRTKNTWAFVLRFWRESKNIDEELLAELQKDACTFFESSSVNYRWVKEEDAGFGNERRLRLYVWSYKNLFVDFGTDTKQLWECGAFRALITGSCTCLKEVDDGERASLACAVERYCQFFSVPSSWSSSSKKAEGRIDELGNLLRGISGGACLDERFLANAVSHIKNAREVMAKFGPAIFFACCSHRGKHQLAKLRYWLSFGEIFPRDAAWKTHLLGANGENFTAACVRGELNVARALAEEGEISHEDMTGQTYWSLLRDCESKDGTSRPTARWLATTFGIYFRESKTVRVVYPANEQHDTSSRKRELSEISAAAPPTPPMLAEVTSSVVAGGSSGEEEEEEEEDSEESRGDEKKEEKMEEKKDEQQENAD